MRPSAVRSSVSELMKKVAVPAASKEVTVRHTPLTAMLAKSKVGDARLHRYVQIAVKPPRV